MLIFFVNLKCNVKEYYFDFSFFFNKFILEWGIVSEYWYIYFVLLKIYYINFFNNLIKDVLSWVF